MSSQEFARLFLYDSQMNLYLQAEGTTLQAAGGDVVHGSGEMALFGEGVKPEDYDHDDDYNPSQHAIYRGITQRTNLQTIILGLNISQFCHERRYQFPGSSDASERVREVIHTFSLFLPDSSQETGSNFKTCEGGRTVAIPNLDDLTKHLLSDTTRGMIKDFWRDRFN